MLASDDSEEARRVISDKRNEVEEAMRRSAHNCPVKPLTARLVNHNSLKTFLERDNPDLRSPHLDGVFLERSQVVLE